MNLSPSTRTRLLAASALAVAGAAAAGFWAPGIERARGLFPAPLDDVYIHFDFARAFAQGHPMAWIAGQGPSSGETAPLYGLVLGVAYACGFSGMRIGLAAAAIALAATAFSVHRVGRLAGGPLPVRVAAGGLVLSVGLVDHTLFSGMEVGLFCALLVAALAALARVRAPISQRNITIERAALRLGAIGALLVWLRPEAIAIVAAFAVIAARGAGGRPALPILARATLPGAFAVLLVLVVNRLATGEATSAGAALKLITHHPFLDDEARARVYLENVGHLWVRGVAELGATPRLALVVLGAAIAALAPRRSRTLAGASLAGALAFALLVSLNSAAPHQNLRYYVPALFLVIVAAALGAAAIARAPRGRVVGGALFAALFAVTLPTLPRQIDRFARAAGNIRDQQVEAGLRLARVVPAGGRILVGDAGAIAYVSRRSAVDALGLGGFRTMPFARAAVHGEGAILELLERLPEGERPTHLALHPSWFSQTTRIAGREIDRLVLEDNVACAGRELVLYEADFGALAGASRPEAVDTLDLADVVSEREHDYRAPFPRGGHVVIALRAPTPGAREVFDAGRILPRGETERFTVRRAPGGGARVVVRTDGQTGGATLTRLRAGEARDAPVRGITRERDGFVEIVYTLGALSEGDALELRAEDGPLHDLHVWIERSDAPQAVRDARSGG